MNVTQHVAVGKDFFLKGFARVYAIFTTLGTNLQAEKHLHTPNTVLAQYQRTLHLLMHD